MRLEGIKSRENSGKIENEQPSSRSSSRSSSKSKSKSSSRSSSNDSIQSVKSVPEEKSEMNENLNETVTNENENGKSLSEETTVENQEDQEEQPPKDHKNLNPKDFQNILSKIFEKLGAGDSLLLKEDHDRWYYPYKIASRVKKLSDLSDNNSPLITTFTCVSKNDPNVRREVVFSDEVFPLPSIFAKKNTYNPVSPRSDLALASRNSTSMSSDPSPSSNRRQKLQRKDSHILDINLEINSDRFNGLEQEISKLITPEKQTSVLAYHPSFQEGGYAPGKIIDLRGCLQVGIFLIVSPEQGYLDFFWVENTSPKIPEVKNTK